MRRLLTVVGDPYLATGTERRGRLFYNRLVGLAGSEHLLVVKSSR
jgi:hypothetical protein